MKFFKFLRRFIGKVLGYENQIHEMRYAFTELNSHVFNHAAFVDRNNKADGNYISEDVVKHWHEFHDLTQKFYRISRT